MHTFFDVNDFVRHFAKEQSKHNFDGTCITIGNFDGVHMGHQALLRRTLQKAQKHNLLPVVVTFWPHPLTVLAKAYVPSLLISKQNRAKFIEEQGIKNILELKFTQEIASLSPKDFIKQVLCPLHCKELVIGYDFSLGKGRSGNFELLQILGKDFAFEVERHPPIIMHNAVVSSTRIRQMLRTGEVYEAEALLGRYFHLEGKVIHGFGRGEGLGFPTANLAYEPTMIPRHGVYATLLTILKSADNTDSLPLCSFPAVTNVGYVPTFGNKDLSVESFILHGNPDLYGATIRLSFVQYIRAEQQFAHVLELKNRISKDVLLAKEILDFS